MMENIFEPYTVQLTFKNSTVLSAEHWKRSFCDLIEALAANIEKAGPCMIGHLKGFVQAPESGFLKISIVSTQQPADTDGALKAGATELTLTLNVLVYGHSREALADITQKTINNFEESWVGRVKMKLSDHFFKMI